MELNLRPKDGNTHTMLVEIVRKAGDIKENERKYAEKMNQIIEHIQNKGYEIVDIKLSMGGSHTCIYETLIMYK